jgi:CHAT domain-containing protein
MNHPEYRYFMQALPFDEIQRQAQAKPLVYLCATSAGGLALVVSQQGIQSIKLPKLNQAALQKQIWSPTDKEVEQINERINQQKSILPEDIQAVSGGYFSMYALWSLKPFLKNISKEMEDNLFIAWQKTLDETTHWLWDAVMGELISAIKKQSEAITLIPIGQLAFLPLHAAWMEDASKPTHRRYALDEMNISYAPSAHALWQANLATKRPVEDLLAVENPDGSLVFSKDEVHAALDVFKRVIHLPGKEAVVKVVKKEMQSAHVLHFSTHGRAGWEKAEQARLTLADDGYLTLLDIFELDLNQARLAVLSACETGVPGLELIDEMIGLPAGMMQAGVPGVVGSLWSVNDGSTALLMARFYRFWRKEGKSPQEALRQAQRWLRDSLFESPYYWAAFTYTGV